MAAHALTGANRLNATLPLRHIHPGPTPEAQYINLSVFRLWQESRPGHHSE
jgi:hypothetical protein